MNDTAKTHLCHTLVSFKIRTKSTEVGVTGLDWSGVVHYPFSVALRSSFKIELRAYSFAFGDSGKVR
jgi:hypothetical protein